MNKLLEILKNKIATFSQLKEEKESSIVEANRLQSIIGIIKENPLNLYELDDDSLIIILQSIELTEEEQEIIKKGKKIYEAWTEFGDMITQINSVNNFIVSVLQKRLSEQRCNLIDKISECKYDMIIMERAKKLFTELNDQESPITDLELLFKILKTSNLTDQEKVNIKIEINARNVSKFKEQTPITSEELSKQYAEQIARLDEKLNTEFNNSTLNRIRAVSELLQECQTSDDISSVLEDWQTSFEINGKDRLKKVINGLLMFKMMEELTLRTVSLDDEEALESVDKTRKVINLLNEYNESLDIMSELKEQEVDLGTTVIDSKAQQCVQEFREDPKDYPNTVVLLSDAVKRDIEDIKDQQILEDSFVLIEKLKKGTIDDREKDKYLHNKNIRDCEVLRPNSKGRQARVVYLKLSPNVYGILLVNSRNGNNPKSNVSTIETRKKSCNIENLINNQAALDTLILGSVETYKSLKDKVSTVKVGVKTHE